LGASETPACISDARRAVAPRPVRLDAPDTPEGRSGVSVLPAADIRSDALEPQETAKSPEVHLPVQSGAQGIPVHPVLAKSLEADRLVQSDEPDTQEVARSPEDHLRSEVEERSGAQARQGYRSDALDEHPWEAESHLLEATRSGVPDRSECRSAASQRRRVEEQSDVLDVLDPAIYQEVDLAE
jgi:hypothetical protein